MKETNRTAYFAFSFSILNIRCSVSNKFHHFEFHHFEFHQFFYVRIPCFNLGIENENNKHIIYDEKFKLYLNFQTLVDYSTFLSNF